MSKTYSAGIATAYGAAKRGGYQGSYTDFCNDIAQLGDITAELGNISAEATTLEAGASATASYNGGVFAFGIPRGNTGAQGERGETGAKGDKGDTGETGATGATGATGNGIASIAKTATVGLVDTYTITFTDGTTSTFDVTNGAEAIDATLSIAGRAADAKATGDEISDLKSDMLPINSKISEGSVITESEISFPNVGKLSTVNGAILSSETAYKTTDYIDLEGVTGIYRTGTTTNFALWIYCFYDVDYTFLGYKGSDSFVDYTIETYNGKQVTWLDIDDYPNAKYIRISWATSRPYTYWVVKGESTYKYDVPHITVNGAEPLKFYGKTIVNFGDSLFGNFRDTNDTTDKSISKMMADATGATVYNAGFGGCRMSYHSQYWRAFSMYALADAITTGVWTDQDEAISAQVSGMPTYFAETLAMLKTIDFSTVDYITIGYGTNDYTGNVFIDYRSGLEEYQYFKGALEYSIRKILTAFPHIRIVVITPCWRWFIENGEYSYSSDDEQSKNTRDLMLTDYVNACKTVCEKMHIPYIDTYITLGFNEYTHLAYFPSNDGTHMNQAGRQLRADRIVGQMYSLF